MDNRYLTKFELQQLLKKDGETRQNVADIGGGSGGSVEVDNRSIEKSTGTTPKLKVKNDATLQIMDSGIGVAMPPFSGLATQTEGVYTGIYVNVDNNSLFVDEDDSKVKVQIETDAPLSVSTNGLNVTCDNESILVEDNELKVQLIEDSGLAIDTDGLYINVDNDTTHINGSNELEVKLSSNGGLAVDSNGIKAKLVEDGGIVSSSNGLQIDAGTGHTIQFGVDADGKWGYKKDGADTVTPFKTGEGGLVESFSLASVREISYGNLTWSGLWYTISQKYALVVCTFGTHAVDNTFFQNISITPTNCTVMWSKIERKLSSKYTVTGTYTYDVSIVALVKNTGSIWGLTYNEMPATGYVPTIGNMYALAFE